MDYTLLQSDLDLWDANPVPDGFADYIDRIRTWRSENGHTHWVGAEHPRYAWLFSQLVLASRPAAVLELGVQCGGSAYGLTRNLAPEALFVGIDSEDSIAAVGALSDFQRLFPRAGNALISARAAAALPLLSPVWDLIHFDHYKECYLPDLDRLVVAGRLHPATICVFHDMESFAKHLRGAIEARFRTSCFIGVPEGALFCQGVLP